MAFSRTRSRLTWGLEHSMRRPIFRGLGLLACLAVGALAACAPGGDLPPAPAPKTAAYRLGVQDQVRVLTFGEDQLSGLFRVNDSGALDMPLLGAVRAQGLTSAELAAEIQNQLKSKKLLRDPSVAVEVAQYRPFFILGEVKNPGQYPYIPGMTMLTAVSVAGGFTYRGYKDHGAVVRHTGPTAVEARLNRQDEVVPGDVITIYERMF